MHLFERIPENLFSLLSSPNRRIHMDALFVVREAFKAHLTIKRDELVVMLMGQLEDAILSMVPEELLEEGDLSSKANQLVRKLIDTGWIRIEFQGDSFEEVVALPDYAVAIVNLLHGLTVQESREYNTLVVSTYNNLRNADRERNEYTYTTLERAHQDTEQLKDLLKSLYGNIGRYHQELVKLTDVNEVLSSHFDAFKAEIMDKIYHPFKTLDSVPRFRGPILEILGKWLQDPPLMQDMAAQALAYKRFPTQDEAILGIVGRIQSIQETYETLGELIDQIDRKHSLYTRSTMEKIQYLISRDKTVKGRIVHTLMQIKGADDDLLDIPVAIFSQSLLDSQSLYNRSQIKKTRVHDPVRVRRVDSGEKERLVAEFEKAMDTQFSNRGIRDHVEALLGASEGGKVHSKDLPLEGDADYMKLILATLKAGQLDMPHTVEFEAVDTLRGEMMTSATIVEKPPYTVPRLVLKRKEKDKYHGSLGK